MIDRLICGKRVLLDMWIPRETMATARRWSDRIYACGITDDDNYTGLSEPDRFYYGYIGELCFCEVLNHYRVRYKFEPHPDGRPDTGTDFIVYGRKHGNAAPINVKTASQSHYRYLMVPEEQFGKCFAAAYIAAHILDGCRLRIEGWISHKELAEYEPTMFKILTRAAPFSELRSIEEMFGLIEYE